MDGRCSGGQVGSIFNCLIDERDQLSTLRSLILIIRSQIFSGINKSAGNPVWKKIILAHSTDPIHLEGKLPGLFVAQHQTKGADCRRVELAAVGLEAHNGGNHGIKGNIDCCPFSRFGLEEAVVADIPAGIRAADPHPVDPTVAQHPDQQAVSTRKVNRLPVGAQGRESPVAFEGHGARKEQGALIQDCPAAVGDAAHDPIVNGVPGLAVFVKIK